MKSGPSRLLMRSRLGRRLDDDERLTHGAPRGASIGRWRRRAWSRQSGGPSPRLSRAGVSGAVRR